MQGEGGDAFVACDAQHNTTIGSHDGGRGGGADTVVEERTEAGQSAILPAHPSQGHSQAQPFSDEDPGVVDERKQKRMLSNRESARRSRVKKQHHLEDMRTQVAKLKAENSEMAARYSMALRHYSQITDENKTLRNHATELSRRLQRLQHAAASATPMGPQLSLSLGLGLGGSGSSLGGLEGHYNPLAFANAGTSSPYSSVGHGNVIAHQMASQMAAYPYMFPQTAAAPTE